MNDKPFELTVNLYTRETEQAWKFGHAMISIHDKQTGIKTDYDIFPDKDNISGFRIFSQTIGTIAVGPCLWMLLPTHPIGKAAAVLGFYMFALVAANCTPKKVTVRASNGYDNCPEGTIKVDVDRETVHKIYKYIIHDASKKKYSALNYNCIRFVRDILEIADVAPKGNSVAWRTPASLVKAIRNDSGKIFRREFLQTGMPSPELWHCKL